MSEWVKSSRAHWKCMEGEWICGIELGVRWMGKCNDSVDDKKGQKMHEVKWNLGATEIIFVHAVYVISKMVGIRIREVNGNVWI